jgi:hypothetical protein
MKIPIGRWLLSLVALFTIAGPYGADWNETHIYNPNWPPHAKFHNAQTMLVHGAQLLTQPDVARVGVQPLVPHLQQGEARHLHGALEDAQAVAAREGERDALGHRGDEVRGRPRHGPNP